MIDNVILLITGTLHSRDTHDLLDRCHPLGVFDTMAALCVATNVAELYNTVLVETPLGISSCLPTERRGKKELTTMIAPYFANCLSANDLDEMNIEIIRNTLYKAYLEDFVKFCQALGGVTSEMMTDLLKVRVCVCVNRYGAHGVDDISSRPIVVPSPSPSTPLERNSARMTAPSCILPADDSIPMVSPD